jgi:hypothetical protein
MLLFHGNSSSTGYHLFDLRKDTGDLLRSSAALLLHRHDGRAQDGLVVRQLNHRARVPKVSSGTQGDSTGTEAAIVARAVPVGVRASPTNARAVPAAFTGHDTTCLAAKGA